MKRIKGKKVTVVGLARSGVGAANLLAELGAKVTVTDRKTEGELRAFVDDLNPAVCLALGSHPEDLFVGADMVVVSPGVSSDIKPLLLAKSSGIPIIGELELAYEAATYGFEEPEFQPILTGKGGFLAVTGTNGKSTTTALLAAMMKRGGFKTMLGGNIGNALTQEILKEIRNNGRGAPSFDFVVAELSSFQLETIRQFRPRVSSILNITPDHLDRYHSMEEYGAVKAAVFENQTADDFLILNRDDPGTMAMYDSTLLPRSSRPKVFFFSRNEEVEGIYLRDGAVYCKIAGPSSACSSPLIRAEEIRIKGVHNLENAMAASAMALLAGCPVEAVIDSLKEFPGLEHRLEFVRELDGVSYFNDSKGTNVDAVMKSLESFSVPIVLIAGGRDKAGDFSKLRDLVRQRVKSLVLIGEASEKIKKALGDVTVATSARDLAEAVRISRGEASRGDVVLLSPACASFDMFANFEDRGRRFKQTVMEMD